MTAGLSLLAFATSALLTFLAAQGAPFSRVTETEVPGGRALKGLVALNVDGKLMDKRFVVRLPSSWNTALVIGAHGGGGGNNFDRQGNVIGTDETALDDVIGRYALSKGFAYASVDRDGTGGRAGMSLTTQFYDAVRTELSRRRQAWTRPPYKATRGTLFKYIKTVKSASEGCVTDE